MGSEQDSLFRVLKDSTRQRMLLLLQNEQPLTYVELMSQSKVSNTGRFNYHLKILADFLEKGDDGKYRLTEKGSHVAQLLTNGPAWNMNENKKANLRNIVLIGTFGFALIFLNPAILENFLGIPLVVGLWPSILTALYVFLVPGAFMWFLCNKRSKNHEIQNLIRAPLFSVLLLACFVGIFALAYCVALLVWGVRIGFPPLQEGVSAAQTIVQNGHEVLAIQQTTYGTMPILTLPLAGIYSFVGFLMAETIQRLRERN
jgi:hypothetical protein